MAKPPFESFEDAADSQDAVFQEDSPEPEITQNRHDALCRLGQGLSEAMTGLFHVRTENAYMGSPAFFHQGSINTDGTHYFMYAPCPWNGAPKKGESPHFVTGETDEAMASHLSLFFAAVAEIAQDNDAIEIDSVQNDPAFVLKSSSVFATIDLLEDLLHVCELRTQDAALRTLRQIPILSTNAINDYAALRKEQFEKMGHPPELVQNVILSSMPPGIYGSLQEAYSAAVMVAQDEGTLNLSLDKLRVQAQELFGIGEAISPLDSVYRFH